MKKAHAPPGGEIVAPISRAGDNVGRQRLRERLPAVDAQLVAGHTQGAPQARKGTAAGGTAPRAPVG